MTGTRISHYQIEQELGRGGMGVVYKARDTRLNRTVAIKVLPAHALASEEDRARFYREAQAAAALSHANIATVYEIDESPPSSDGGVPTEGGSSSGVAGGPGEPQPFIAMEYVEGESLADRIAKGPLPLKETVSIASQIAEGLNAAHTKDIVHRDIKPGNVMLTRAGEAKILDFGLAKTAASTKLTRMGSTLGTFAYMSPEQARGEEVDARTDVWSLGAVLCEMITGRPPFPGEYEQAVVYGILNEDPEPPTALRTGVPMELERIVLKCLSKDRRQRYQHVDEVAVDLEAADLKSGATSPASRASQATSFPLLDGSSWKRVSGLAVGSAGALAVVFFLGRLSADLLNAADDTMIMRTSIALAPGQTFSRATNSIAITRDGSVIAYAAGDSGTGTTRIYLRQLASSIATPVPGSEGGLAPFFSPAGDRLGYVASGVTYVYDIASRIIQRLGSTESFPDGADWRVDDSIFRVVNGSLVRVDLAGASAVATRLEVERGLPAFGNLRSPQFLPRANAVVFSDWNWSQRSGNVLILDLSSSRIDTLLADATSAQVAGEKLWFIRQGALHMAPMDTREVTLTGDPVLIQPDVRGTFRGHYLFAVSDNNRVIYVPAQQELVTAVWVGRDGTETPLGRRGIKPAIGLGWPAISLTGSNIAITKRRDVDWTLWTYNVDTDRETQLTFGTVGIDGDIPVWSPDGKHIVYQTILESGTYETRRTGTDGTSQPQVIRRLDYGLGSYSPDGQHISFSKVNERGGSSIAIYSTVRDSVYTLVDGGSSSLGPAVFSPDGDWIAYASNETGMSEIFVTDFPAGTFKRRISENGGSGPTWSSAGDELFYQEGQWMVAVKYRTNPVFDASPPEYLFEGYRREFRARPTYAVDASGQRFFMTKVIGGDLTQMINLIQNVGG